MSKPTEKQNEQLALAEKIVDEVMNTEEDNRLAMIGNYLQQIENDSSLSNLSQLKLALESMGNFYLSLNCVGAGNFTQALELMNASVMGLNEVGLKEFGHVASGMLTYINALVNTQQLNLGKALELFAQAKAQLANSLKYGRQFQGLIDHFEPDALNVAMVTALNQLDFSKAKALAAQTFKASINLAERYYDETNPSYFTFKGLAYYYRSYYSFSEALYDFRQFKFQEVAAQNDVIQDALQAQEYLAKGDLSSIILQRNYTLSKSIAEAVGALIELSSYVNQTFLAKDLDTYDPAVLQKIRKKVQIATDTASEAGPEMIVFTRSIESIGDLITSVENIISKRVSSKKRHIQYPATKLIHPEEANVFLVHGHDHGTKETIARFLERLDLKVTILQDEPTRGQTILEKLIDYADQSTYAIVLLTADDRGGVRSTSYEEQQMRARQNVIFELGYFLAALGREHVCAIYQEGVEIPSDYHGIIYITLDKSDAWKLRVAREIKASGINIDLNKAF